MQESRGDDAGVVCTGRKLAEGGFFVKGRRKGGVKQPKSNPLIPAMAVRIQT